MTTETDQSTKRERQKARRAERREHEAAQAKRGAVGRLTAKILIGVVALAAIGGVGYLLAQSADATFGVAAAQTVTDTPALPAPTGGGAADIAAGATAPTVTGQSFDGADVTVGGQGQPQAITFVAHWCPHCQDEVPLVKDWVDQGLVADGVELVGVSTFHDPASPNWPPDEWLEREEFPGEVLVDHDDTAAQAYGLQGTPMWVFVDAQGTVVARWSGQIDAERFAEGVALAAGTAG